jgi:putative membrane protein
MDQTGQGRRWRRLVTITAVLAVLVIALSAPAVAHTGDTGSHHHDGWMGSHDGGVGFLWMILWMVALLGIPLGLGYLVYTRIETGGDSTDEALSVLRRRYASGEIDEEEFDARRRKLRAKE